MKTTKFKSKVTKGNNRGAGFIRIPSNIRANFLVGNQYKTKINSKIEYYCKIRDYSGKGIFIPIEINLKNKLYGKYVEVELEKVDGFYTKVGSKGRIYIPNFYNLKDKDIISISYKIEGELYNKYPRIYLRQRDDTKEFIFYLNSNLYKKEVIIKVDNIFEKNKLINSKPFFNELLTDFDFAEVEKNKIIVYYGNRVPIMIDNKTDIEDLVHYLGCYFADGTKKGNNWGICASTFEQAIYYNKMHKKLINNAKIVNSISYSDPDDKNKELLKNELRALWQKETKIELKNVSVNIYYSKDKNALNRNPYGTLIFKENRELTRIYYVRLLGFLFNKIRKEDNQKLAIDFILGVLEGDGSPGARGRGHIIITTSKKDSQILKEVLNSTNFKFNIRKEGKNKYSIHIGSLEIIKNISILKDRLFKYYPKRRKILKERLGNIGCVRFLLGKQKKTSNWLIGQLNKYGILDGKGNLTRFGNQVKRDLSEFINS